MIAITLHPHPLHRHRPEHSLSPGAPCASLSHPLRTGRIGEVSTWPKVNKCGSSGASNSYSGISCLDAVIFPELFVVLIVLVPSIDVVDAVCTFSGVDSWMGNAV